MEDAEEALSGCVRPSLRLQDSGRNLDGAGRKKGKEEGREKEIEARKWEVAT